MVEQRQDTKQADKSGGSFDRSALIDLIAILAVLISVKQALLPYTQLYAGPASTLSAMILATILLKIRDFSWADLGLRRPESWPRTFGLTIITLVLFLVTAGSIDALVEPYFPSAGTSGRFDHVEGNIVAYAAIMALVWTHSSFFEELLFRAFVITKTSRMLGGGLGGDIVAVLFSSVFFGYRHFYYQGLHGAIVTSGIGFLFAILYLWFGRRNILPLILAHGVVNSIFQTLRFLGVDD